MFLFKSLLILFVLMIVFGLFSMLAVAGAIRDLFFGRRGSADSGEKRDGNATQTRSTGEKPQKQRKIYSKDEGEYVDFTEV